jgi:hypothetical protein
MAEEELKKESLETEANHLIEEARMVLPGIQALFGFQLIAVFNTRFDIVLTAAEQRLHLSAMLCIVLAILLIMAPAAYHRQAERGVVSRYFVNLASRLIAIAMLALTAGVAAEVFIVARMILDDVLFSAAIAAAVGVAFVGFWFVFPYVRRRQRHDKLMRAR